MDKLSQKTLKKLDDVLNDIDNEIGNLCKIKIEEINKIDCHCSYPPNCHCNNPLTIIGNNFISIEIYDAIDEYKELEGIYDNFGDHVHFNIKGIEQMLHKKYNNERFSGMHIYKYKFKCGICKKCNEWKSENNNLEYFSLSTTNDSYIKYGNNYKNCQACGISWTDCKYYSTSVNYNNLSITNNTNQLIAKFRLIRQNSNNLNNKISSETSENIIPLTIII